MAGKKTSKKSEAVARQKKAKTGSETPESLIAASRAAAFTDEAPSAAFAHYRPLAEAIPKEDLPVFTGQPLLMRANIKLALRGAARALRRVRGADPGQTPLPRRQPRSPGYPARRPRAEREAVTGAARDSRSRQAQGG